MTMVSPYLTQTQNLRSFVLIHFCFSTRIKHTQIKQNWSLVSAEESIIRTVQATSNLGKLIRIPNHSHFPFLYALQAGYYLPSFTGRKKERCWLLFSSYTNLPPRRITQLHEGEKRTGSQRRAAGSRRQAAIHGKERAAASRCQEHCWWQRALLDVQGHVPPVTHWPLCKLAQVHHTRLSWWSGIEATHPKASGSYFCSAEHPQCRPVILQTCLAQNSASNSCRKKGQIKEKTLSGQKNPLLFLAQMLKWMFRIGPSKEMVSFVNLQLPGKTQ